MYEAALDRVGGHAVHPTQQQRVVRDDQLRAQVLGLGHRLLDGVDAEQHPRDLLRRVPAHEPDGIPLLREARRVVAFEDVEDLG